MKRLKILALSSRLPYPILGGDRLRAYNLLRIMAQEHEVDLLALHESSADSGSLAHLRSFLGSVRCIQHSSFQSQSRAIANLIVRRLPLQVGYYYYPRVARDIQKHIHQYDLVYCFHVRTSEYVRYLPCAKVVDLVDAISLNYSRALTRSLSPKWRAVYQIERPILLRYEVGVVTDFDRAFLASSVDLEYLAKHGADKKKMVTIANGVDNVDIDYEPTEMQDIDLLFIGNMQTQSNQEAVLFFAQEILPLVRQWRPSTRFYVVGHNPSKKIHSLHDGNNFIVTGSVLNHKEFLTQAKVVVAPMTFGAGTQFKVLEAMNYGKPVVLTTLAAAGINGRSGTHFLVKDNPRDFAEAIITLLSEPSLRDLVGHAGKELVRSSHTWDTVGCQLLSEIQNLVLFRRRENETSERRCGNP